MPCYDPQAGIESVNKVNSLTDMLCRLCKMAEKNGVLSFLDKDIQNWWKKHKAQDTQR